MIKKRLENYASRKRLLHDLKKLKTEPLEMAAAPKADNIYEWTISRQKERFLLEMFQLVYSKITQSNFFLHFFTFCSIGWESKDIVNFVMQ